MRFVDQFVDDEEPANKHGLWDRAKGEPGLSLRLVRSLVDEAVKAGLIVMTQKQIEGRGRPLQGYVKAPGSDLWKS